MADILECYYWNNNSEELDDIEFEFIDIGRDIEVKKPFLDKRLLNVLLAGITEARQKAEIDVFELLNVVISVMEKWKKPTYKFRQKTLEIMPYISGFSRQMVERLFDYYIDVIDLKNFGKLGDADPNEYKEFSEYGDGFLKAYGKKKVHYRNFSPKVIGHIVASNMAGVPAFELIIDKFIGASSWLQVSTEEPVFAVLFAKSIEEIHPELAKTIVILPYLKSQYELQELLFHKADIVRVFGSSKLKKEAIKISEKYNTQLAGHWESISFAVIGKEYLADMAKAIAELLSLDISVWDQQGCFSPQLVYVEKNDKVTPSRFAALLAEELKKTTIALPKGLNSGKINILDEYHRNVKKQLFNKNNIQLHTDKDNNWLVIYDDSSAEFEVSGFFRIIKIKPVSFIEEIPALIKPFSNLIQTVGLALPQNKIITFANSIAQYGGTNFRCIGGMAFPKIWEPWDGRFQMTELIEQDNVRWVSINMKNISSAINTCLARKRKIVDENVK